MFRRGNKGFTLIELLVILAIMAILSTISFVSIQYVVSKNVVKAQEAKCKDAIQKCDRICGNLNIGAVQGSIAFGTDVRLDTNGSTLNFGRFEANIDMSSEYNIEIQTSLNPQTLGSNVTKDTVYVCINDVNTDALTLYKLDHSLELKIKGAWFYKSGTKTPVYTYNNTTKQGTEGSVAVT